MIQLSNLAGKPVLIAHQVLESMTTGPRPTRSEVSDIHNSIMNGVDALVLSSETATGLNPISTIQMLSKIIFEAEKETNYPEFQQRLMKMCPKPQPTSESIASSSVSCARKTNASLIVCLTELGGTAKLVAKYRPEIPVIGATKVATTARQLNMCFGVKPYYVEGEVDLLKKVIDYAVGLGLVKRGEIVVVTSGQVIGFAEGTTTKMQVVIA